MFYKLFYFDDVKRDIKESKKWYDLQKKGLGERFVIDVKEAVFRLKTNPQVHTIRYKNIRIAHADVFPFSIHFYIDELAKQVNIIAIVHNGRDPEFPQKRI